MENLPQALKDYLLDCLDAHPNKKSLQPENGLHFDFEFPFGNYTYSTTYAELTNNIEGVVEEIITIANKNNDDQSGIEG